MVWTSGLVYAVLSGYGDPAGKKSPSGDGDGEISPPLKVTGTGTGIFYPAGTGMVS
jgi:hypothetical protein